LGDRTVRVEYDLRLESDFVDLELLRRDAILAIAEYLEVCGGDFGDEIREKLRLAKTHRELIETLVPL
jgi:hypothetical protein